jgi:hypothetical protein
MTANFPDTTMEWRQDWKLMAFGMLAAVVDGVVIAQVWDWLSTVHRMSIWILL